MERKVIQFQILPAKGKLWRFNTGLGCYDIAYSESMIIYLFSDGTLQCEPAYSFDNLYPMDNLEGSHFISYLRTNDFDLDYIKENWDCTLEEAKEQIRELIEVSGIRCSDEVLGMLK